MVRLVPAYSLDGPTPARRVSRLLLASARARSSLLSPFWARNMTGNCVRMFTLYATEDLLRKQVVTGLFGGTALADSAPLAELIAKYVDQRMFRAIARVPGRAGCC